MPRPPNPQTPEAVELTRAIDAKGVGAKAQIADTLNVSPGLVSQYASGHRPVPWDRAEPLGSAVGLPPEHISAEYRRVADHFAASLSVRLSADIIRRTVDQVRESLKKLKRPYVGPDEDPELFAEMLRLEVIRLRENDDGERGIQSAGGPGGRVAGAAGKAKAGDAARPEVGRGRKRASA